jgi:hypothetical protein
MTNQSDILFSMNMNIFFLKEKLFSRRSDSGELADAVNEVDEIIWGTVYSMETYNELCYH